MVYLNQNQNLLALKRSIGSYSEVQAGPYADGMARERRNSKVLYFCTRES